MGNSTLQAFGNRKSGQTSKGCKLYMENEGWRAKLESSLKAIKHSNLPEKITVLSSNPEKTARLYDVDSEYFLKFFKPILETDVLISGGGSLLQDITSLKSLIYYLTVIVIALVFNKKVVIFAQGFTPFRTKLGKFFTNFVLKYCDKIYVRDIKSQELLKTMKINSELVSDPVFGIENFSNEHKGIGVQLRSFPSLTEDFLNNLADSIAEKFKDKEIKLLSLQDSLDFSVLESFSKKLEQRGVKSKIYKNESILDTINLISGLEYLIGMRFHANLIAAKAGVKVLGINYDIKVLNLAKHIGFPHIGLNEKSFCNEYQYKNKPIVYKEEWKDTCERLGYEYDETMFRERRDT